MATETTVEKKSLKEKIFDIQQNIGAITKDSINPYHESSYFDINKLLSELRVYLEANRLLLTQPIINGFVYTKVEDLDSGEVMESSIKLPELDNPQKIGSCITYYRRYTCASLFALQSEDDDGNLAAIPKKDDPQSAKPEIKDEDKEWLEKKGKEFDACLVAIKSGKYTVSDIRKKFKVSKETAKLLKL